MNKANHIKVFRLSELDQIEDPLKIESIHLLGGVIRDLKEWSFLERFHNLKRLNLSYGEISDLTPLRNLRSLRYLNLCFQRQILDLESLRALTELEELDLFESHYASLEPLTHLKKLKKLTPGRNINGLKSDYDVLKNLIWLRDLRGNFSGKEFFTTVISQLKQLETIIIPNELNLSDLSPLGSLNHLRNIILRGDGKEIDLTPLRSLQYLKRVEISKSKVRDIEPLKTLKNLEVLSVLFDGLEALEFFRNLKRIKGIYITGTGSIKSLEPLSDAIQLRGISLSRNAISDLTPLSGLTSLQHISLSQNNISDLTPLGGLNNLKTILMAKNQIKTLESIKHLLKKDTRFSFQDNPIEIPPREILKKGRKAVLEWFEQQEIDE